jgi:hypothetical protein
LIIQPSLVPASTGVKGEKLIAEDAVIAAARRAKEAGSTRFCMGAAWRDTIGRKSNFKQILNYVSEIRSGRWFGLLFMDSFYVGGCGIVEGETESNTMMSRETEESLKAYGKHDYSFQRVQEFCLED